MPQLAIKSGIKEIFESAQAKKADLVHAAQLKFLAVLDPTKNNIVNALIKYSVENDDRIKVAASLFNESIIYFKMNAVFIFKEDQYF